MIHVWVYHSEEYKLVGKVLKIIVIKKIIIITMFFVIFSILVDHYFVID